jgi:hypothetical protein
MKSLSSHQRKNLYENLTLQVSDDMLLCILFPLMKEKNLPSLNSRLYHYMILNKVKYPRKIEVDKCSLNKDIETAKKFDFCNLCARKSLIHGNFCVDYLRYHEHLRLCINCSSKIERRTSRLIELVGLKEYYTILRKIVLLNRILNKDVSNIIMGNLINLFKLHA